MKLLAEWEAWAARVLQLHAMTVQAYSILRAVKTSGSGNLETETTQQYFSLPIFLNSIKLFWYQYAEALFLKVTAGRSGHSHLI